MGSELRQEGYWSKRTRLRRRTALRMAAAGGLGAATLAILGCGDDEEPSSGGDQGTSGGTSSSSGGPSGGTNNTSQLLTTPTDTSGAAVRGGTFRDYLVHDSWDPNVNSFGAHRLASFVYSRLTKFGNIRFEDSPAMTIEGDFASSWEIADEGTTVIMKVRGLKWDERAPTNGRVSDAEDVVFAWNRWVESNARAYEVANEWNPNGAVLNVTAPDAETAVFKLAFPYGPLFPMMSDGYHLLVFPREADGGYDPRSEARGTGAWFVEEDTWPTAIRFKRNPNWYESDRPYFDEWIVNNVSDYSAGVAQLRTGGLDKYDPTSQEDVLLTKKDVPSLVMVQQANFTKALGGVTFFGQQPGSPYLDDRVRKAMSMLLDRDLWLDTYSNRERFESEGLPVETTWTGWVGPGYEFHLDPREDDLGEGAKFMRYDPEGAQELLAAAGVSLPIESTFWAANNTLTPEREALLGMIQATGAFKANIHSVPLDEFLDATATPGRAWDFEGFGMQTYNETADWDWVHSLMFDPRSTNFQIPQEDPKMTDFYQQQRRELDQQKRGEILKEFQRYAAQTMYYVPVPGGQWKNFRIAQPWIGNWGYFSGWEGFAFGQELYTHYWYDESKA